MEKFSHEKELYNNSVIEKPGSPNNRVLFRTRQALGRTTETEALQTVITAKLEETQGLTRRLRNTSKAKISFDDDDVRSITGKVTLHSEKERSRTCPENERKQQQQK